ncbi:MAG: glycosyltransferase family 2 protein [Candidatus Latescibacteria bacterium]|nr:glycosyltransferase family 2 protein [Candidatus Latescibacterota bacterium]
MRQQLSACVITYNEERNIGKCLKSLTWVDEIVVVDAFSQDNTPQIARQFTPRVLQNRWPGFVQQKNFALSKATYDWILALDADEVVSGQLKHSILESLSSEPPVDGYFIPRRTFYLGRWINHCGWYPEYRLRLFRKSKARWGGIDPHDRVVLTSEKVGYLQGDLYHYPYRNISDHLKKIDRYSTLSAQQMAKQDRSSHLQDIILRPLLRFTRMYLCQLGFLDGKAGLLISALGAFYVFNKYAKLWELTRGGKS